MVSGNAISAHLRPAGACCAARHSLLSLLGAATLEALRCDATLRAQLQQRHEGPRWIKQEA